MYLSYLLLVRYDVEPKVILINEFSLEIIQKKKYFAFPI